MFSHNTCRLPSQFPPPPPSPCLTRVSASFGRCSRRRSNRIRHNKLSSPNTSSSESKRETIVDLTRVTLFPSFNSNVRRFISSGRDACRDLQSLFSLDDNRRLVVSCRPSTVQFVGTSAALSMVAFSALRVLLLLVSRFLWRRRNASGYRPMVRRDRSLGGREVVVGWGQSQTPTPTQRTLANPLSPVQRPAKNHNKVRVEKKLPKWWPTIINSNAAVLDVDEQEDYKREAYRVVRAIVNSRMRGNDIFENDIIQLRQLCRTSGVQVSVEPTNIRDSLYRASVNFVLNACSSAPAYSTSVHINGEDAQQFLAGFTENIGLENVRAATIVSAAVAARTRSGLLQAWALEMQGKHVDTLAELSKICLLLRTFPPEESSPEMEMVSRGLVKHLKLEQRKHLMFLFGKVCCEDSHRFAREALGLIHSQNCCTDQLEDNIAP